MPKELNIRVASPQKKDYKWTIIKCYYCMFHVAKALLFRVGYREKKHLAIVVVLEELNKQTKIEQKHITNFKASISAREEAESIKNLPLPVTDW